MKERTRSRISGGPKNPNTREGGGVSVGRSRRVQEECGVVRLEEETEEGEIPGSTNVPRVDLLGSIKEIKILDDLSLELRYTSK